MICCTGAAVVTGAAGTAGCEGCKVTGIVVLGLESPEDEDGSERTVSAPAPNNTLLVGSTLLSGGAESDRCEFPLSRASRLLDSLMVLSLTLVDVLGLVVIVGVSKG